MLTWLMNMGFAGGGAAVLVNPLPPGVVATGQIVSATPAGTLPPTPTGQIVTPAAEGPT